MPDRNATDARATYEIEVAGSLNPHWDRWLDGLSVTARPAGDGQMTTVLAATVDQVGLRGLLCRLWDLNLVVVWVIRRQRGADGNGAPRAGGSSAGAKGRERDG